MNYTRRSSTRALALWVFILCLAATALPLLGQSFYGTIVGNITDPSGAVVADADVTLTNSGTGETKTIKSDANGNYQFVNLVPGVYQAAIEASGFKRLSMAQIEVRVDTVSRANAVLQVGGVTETIEVSAQSPLLQTDTVAVGQIVEGRQVQEMPLNGRNIMNLLAIVPSVVPQGASSGSPIGNQSKGNNTSMAGWGNYQIGGGMANQSANYIDGVPMNMASSNNVALIPTQDAIQEFNVLTNTVSAEYGGFSGGVVNMTTKSGSNTFHGSAYEYFRNTVLNANDFFNNKNGVSRAPFHQNQWGGNLGGPIIKNKTFFSFVYEGFALRKGLATTETVPTLKMRLGDFTEITQKIYDPLTTCGQLGNPACGSSVTRTAFAGNIIPANRIDPSAKAMLNYYPLPNLAGTTNNLVYNKPAGGNSYQYTGRVDYNVSDNQRIFARYTLWNMSSHPADAFAGQSGAKTGVTFTDIRNQQVVLGDTITFSQSTIADFRFAYMRVNNMAMNQNVGIDMSQLGSAWGTLARQVTYQMYPRLNITGGYRTSPQSASEEKDNDFSFVGNLTKMLGRHTLKFGGQWRHDADSSISYGTGGGGLFTFDATLTSLNGTNASTSGYGFASFMLGYPTSMEWDTQTLTNQQLTSYGFFITDTFQATSKLTLNLGLRWDQPGSFTEENDRDAVWLGNLASPLAKSTGLPLKGNAVHVNSSDYPDRQERQLKWNQFSPRVGFAYRMTDKLVMRAGYGINYLSTGISGGGPKNSAVNANQNLQYGTLNGGLTPNITFSNPYPNGLIKGTDNLDTLLGQTLTAPAPVQPLSYVQQWNLNIQRELGSKTMVQIGYAASKGTHLPSASAWTLNQLPSQYFSLGSSLQTQVANPFYGLMPSTLNPYGKSTIARGYLLNAYPQYLKLSASRLYGFSSTYHAMQLSFQRRFAEGASLSVNYTWSKFLSNTDTLSGAMESALPGAVATGAAQNYNDPSAEKSLISQDVPHRLVASYVYDFPLGKGKKFLGGTHGVLGGLVSGWTFNGTTIFQSGYPMPIAATSNNLSSFNVGTLRPNVVPGCVSVFKGRAQDRLSQWFNTACYVKPSDNYSLGNEPRTDPHVRTHGVNNWDVALRKKTALRENINLTFGIELFNVFNRTQFAAPGYQVGNANFGTVTTTANEPRLVQFALRLSF